MNDNSPSRAVFQHHDNIETVDYLEDYLNEAEDLDDVDVSSGEGKPLTSDVLLLQDDAIDRSVDDLESADTSLFQDDHSLSDIVPITPRNAVEIDAVPEEDANEFTPLTKLHISPELEPQRSLALMPASEPLKRSNFLADFLSPPESKPRNHHFHESFSVDNRTRTPLFPLHRQESNSSLNSKTSNTFLPSRYLSTNQESPQPRQNTNPAPAIMAQYSSPSATNVGILASHAAFTTSNPGYAYSPSNQSTSTRYSTQSHAHSECSSVASRRQSKMSFRSSTSMSLLYGEVIMLDSSRFLSTTGSQSETNSRPAYSRAGQDDEASQRFNIEGDIEKGNEAFEGMEIGGGIRPIHQRMPHLFSEQSTASVTQFASLETFAECCSKVKQQVAGVLYLTRTELRRLTDLASATSQRIVHRYRPPLSPRARDLNDLNFLRQSHKLKLGHIADDDDLEDHYDFVIVLTPQEAYRYWADLLDFRAEHLGTDTGVSMETILETASTQSTDESVDSDEALAPQVPQVETPSSGTLRRRGKQCGTSPRWEQQAASPSAIAKRTSTANSLFSPAIGGTAMKRRSSRLSMFEKAVGMQSASCRQLLDESLSETPLSQMHEHRGSVASASSGVRRRWGNHAMNTRGSSAGNMMSPPVRSLTRGAGSLRKLRVTGTPSGGTNNGDTDENRNPNVLRSEEDIPNPVIPRGIAARTNGLLQFLSALKRGLIVRRHRPNKTAVFCKLFSTDGGDTIQYQLIDPEEAMVAFKEQRVRYNRKLTHSSSPNTVRTISRDWSCIDGPEEGDPDYKFKLPDHIAAQRYREKFVREHGFAKRLSDLATKAANSGIVRIADIVAVHPASHLDPRPSGSRKGELGTASLRKSQSNHYTAHTFSLVTIVGQRFKTGKASTVEANENKWYSGEGSELQFKTLDFEAATEGEYWLIFRGFLLLHRDAAVGRFAAERRAGIGGGNRTRDHQSGDLEEDELENRLHRDEFLEPVTVGALEKWIVKVRKLDTTYMDGYVLPTAVPPPSDYFLGFRTPGTQVCHFDIVPRCFDGLKSLKSFLFELSIDMEQTSFGRSGNTANLRSGYSAGNDQGSLS